MSDIGVKIGVGGEAQFKKALGDINRNLKTLGTEMKAVTSAFDKNDTSASKLAAQNQVLNKQIDEQKNKLEMLKARLADSAKEYGENDAKTQKWQQSVNLATADLNKMERQLDGNNKELAEYSEEAKKAVWQTQGFKDKVAKMGESLKNVGSKISGFGKTMSMAVTAPLVAAGAASFKFAADLQDAMGATDQIFKGASRSIKSWADTLGSEYGIAEAEALSYANTMGAMLQNIGGLSEQEASKQAQTLVQLAGDLAAMFGGTTESAVQALTGALKGNNAMLDNYGMGVNDATIKAKALEMGLYDGTGAIELQTKQAATLALVMEQTADAQGQAGREANGASGSLRSMQTELKNLSTDIGEVLLPVITPLIADLRDMVKRFGELSPETQKTIVVIAGLAASIGPLLIVVGGAISAVGTITAALPALGAAFAAVTGPVGLFIAGVVELIATIVALWKNNEDFRNGVIEIWEGIKVGIKGAVDTISKFFNQTIPEAIDTMVTFFANLPTRIWDALLAAIEKIRQWGADISAWAKTEIPARVEEIRAYFAELPGKMLQIGRDLIVGLWNGINDKIGWLKTQVRGIVDKIKSWFTGKSGFDEHSPSKWAAGVGEYVMLGLANGLTGGLPAVLSAAGKTTDRVKRSIVGAAQKVNNALMDEEKRLLAELDGLKKQTAKTDEQLLEESLNAQLKLIQDYQKQYDDAIAEVQKSQDGMADKLASFGDLFTRTETAFGNKLELGYLREHIQSINAYGDALDRLKARGASESLLEEIKGLGVGDAIDYTSKLLDLTDAEYGEYMALWDEKQAAAQRVAQGFYQSEMDALKTEFVDNIPKELDGVKDQMRGLGVLSGQGLAQGFLSQASYIRNTFVGVLNSALFAAKDAMQIASPSKKWAEVGENMAAGLGVGFVGRMREVARQISDSIPAETPSVTRAVTGAVNGVAALMGGGSPGGGGTYIIQTVLDGRVIAETVFDPLKSVARQRGVSLA